MSYGRTRAVAVAALALVAAATAVMLMRADAYEITAEFENAGRLVTGGEVRLGGRAVGSIEEIDLAANGLAAVRLSITDDAARPLPRDTRARIRAVGAATLTNNFIELTPGPADGPALADGSVLATDKTSGIVDVDAIFSSLDPKARADIRTLTAHSADIFAGSGDTWFNGTLQQFSPALTELRRVTENLNADRTQLRRFVTASADAAQAVAERRPDLVAAVEHTARTLKAVDAQREHLTSVLERAPGVLDQGSSTLAATAATLADVRPMLQRIPAAARPAGPFLDDLRLFLERSRPAIGQLNEQLPSIRAALGALPQLAGPADRALTATAAAFGDAQPILRGVRYYAPDFLIGLFNGLLTIGSGNYNKYGHYIHISFVQSLQDTLGGIFSGQLANNPLVPGLFELQRNFLELCPGAGNPPAPDGSNDYVPDPSLCNPDTGLQATVNQP
jgi:phospholipid/cholesterol/gamma-HCH transport system substrate-binding protein